MKWVAISGSWRTVSPDVERDVCREIVEIFSRGDGIVTGGALGVDFIATREALQHDSNAARIKIILPTSLDVFSRHFPKRADEGVITTAQATKLIAQLKDVKTRNPAALIEMDFDACTQETYYARNQAVIDAADALAAFQVNNSQGVQDAIDKATARGLPVRRKEYAVQETRPCRSAPAR